MHDCKKEVDLTFVVLLNLRGGGGGDLRCQPSQVIWAHSDFVRYNWSSSLPDSI